MKETIKQPIQKSNKGQPKRRRSNDEDEIVVIDPINRFKKNSLQSPDKRNEGQGGDLLKSDRIAKIAQRINNSPRILKIEKVDTHKGIPTIDEWEANPPGAEESEDQIIETLLPHSPGAFGIIAGRTSIGKTNLLLNFAHGLATGTTVINLACEKIGVAMLAFEGDYYNLKDRRKKIKNRLLAADENLIFDLLHFDLLKFSGKSPNQKLLEVVARLKDTEGVHVAVLDPVKYLVPGDYLNPKDVAFFTNLFAETLTELNMVGIVTLPIHKPQNKNCLINVNDIYSIKGATEWVDAATFCILVEKVSHKPKDSGELIMGFVKRRNNPNDDPDNINVRFSKPSCVFEKIAVSTSVGSDGDLSVEIT